MTSARLSGILFACSSLESDEHRIDEASSKKLFKSNFFL